MNNEEFRGKWKKSVEVCRDLIKKSEDIPSAEVGSTLSIEQAAVRLGVSKQTLRNWENSGKLVATRTEGGDKGLGHRRYLESDINALRRTQASIPELILPDIRVSKLRELGEMLLANFDDDEKVHVMISQSAIDGKVRIMIDSDDGLTTVRKTFNMEE